MIMFFAAVNFILWEKLSAWDLEDRMKQNRALSVRRSMIDTKQVLLLKTSPQPHITHNRRIVTQQRQRMSERLGVVWLMVSVADKPAKAVLLREKNTLPWLISHEATSAFIYQAFIQKIWSPGTMYQSSMRSALAWPPKLTISPIPPCVSSRYFKGQRIP